MTCEPCTSSPALGGGFTPISSSDTSRSAPSSGAPLPATSCAPAPTPGGGPVCGCTSVTCGCSIHPTTPGEWISSQQASLARIFPSLVLGTASAAQGRAYGRKWSGWSMRFDHRPSGSKIPLQLPLAGLMSSYPTLPPWGSMRSGWCSPRPLLVPRTFVLGGFALPSVAPTMTATDKCGRAYQHRDGQDVPAITGWLRLLPMLIASDWKSTSPAKSATNARPLREVIGAMSDGGQLNPAWGAWFMGWPIDALASKPSGTGRSRCKRPAPK